MSDKIELTPMVKGIVILGLLIYILLLLVFGIITGFNLGYGGVY